MEFKDFIQVAGVHNLEEAERVVAAGADAIGLPLRLPVNKEDLTEFEAKQLVSALKIPSVLITYLDKCRDIIDFVDYLGVPIVQLHGPIELDELKGLRKERPGLILIKSLIIRSGKKDQAGLYRDVDLYSSYCQAYITDSHNPKTGADGATGITHDWNISRHIVENSPIPVILAGGIQPSNVFDAIQKVRPAGVDTHTGVEDRDGYKSLELLSDFVRKSKESFATL